MNFIVFNKTVMEMVASSFVPYSLVKELKL